LKKLLKNNLACYFIMMLIFFILYWIVEGKVTITESVYQYQGFCSTPSGQVLVESQTYTLTIETCDGYLEYVKSDYAVMSETGCGTVVSQGGSESLLIWSCEIISTPQPTPASNTNSTSQPTPTPAPNTNSTSQPTPTPAPTQTSNGGGDPHFRMWDGKRISYQGECDLVVFQIPQFAAMGKFYLHARTTIRKYHSAIRNLAFRIGDDVFEVAGKDEFYLNGNFSNYYPSSFAGFPIKGLNSTRRNHQVGKTFSIDFFEYGHMVIDIYREFLYITVYGTARGFKDAVGLMGSWSKPGMFGRNNKTILKNSKIFAEEWQVLNSEPMIFHEARPPQYPQPCKMAPSNARRIEDVKAQRMAHKACSRFSGDSFDMCVMDVLQTGDVNMAFVQFFD